MATRTFTPDTADALTLDITAGSLELTVEVLPEGSVRGPVELALRGPEEVVAAATSRTGPGRWIVEIPAPEPTVITGGRGLTVVGNTVYGGIHTSRGDNVVVNGVVLSGGSVINGSVVTGGGEPVVAVVRLAAGSSLHSRVENGRVTVTGAPADVDHDGHNASLVVNRTTGDVVAATHNGDIEIGRAAGEIDASTHNGNIYVAATGTRTSARIHNGDATITAAGDGPISARTHNGNVRVHKNGHRPDVRTRAHNGSEYVS